MKKGQLYRMIPKVDVLLEIEPIHCLITKYGREAVRGAIRKELEEVRTLIGICQEEEEVLRQLQLLPELIVRRVKGAHTPGMRMVINGTGTILHTNLGRAPISLAHIKKMKDVITGYSNLEYNLEEGKRGERSSHFEALLCGLTGAEAAMAVNNNAAAVMLIVHSIAKGGQVVISRGELVEIGGGFRIPDVIEQSGAELVEVGTTNKTHYFDYANVITEETKALLKVHTSNYRIVGFTEAVSIDELVPLAREHDLPIIQDLGSGVLVDISKYGLSYEPTIQDSIRKGADIVCFSGDKMLGGPQAGIIIGKKKYIDTMKKNPLARAFRIDKFTAAVLEVVLQEYLSEEKAIQNIPVLRMMTEPIEEVEKRAHYLWQILKQANLSAEVGLEKCDSQIGGGSLPLEQIPSMAVTIKPQKVSVTKCKEAMRHLEVPIIPRTTNDVIYLDVRTIETRWFEQIGEMLGELL